MSLMSLFKKRAAESDGGKTSRLILDGTSMAASANGGTVRPPDQVQILERFGQFGRREKIPMTVLFVGKALRELDEDGQYRDITVLNADRSEDLPALLRRTLQKQDRATTVVVSGSAEMIAVAESMGATVMRDTTLRKVVDRMPGDRGSGGRSPRNRGGGGGGGGGGQAKRQAAPTTSEKTTNETNGANRDAEKPTGGIDDLIDFV